MFSVVLIYVGLSLIVGNRIWAGQVLVEMAPISGGKEAIHNTGVPVIHNESMRNVEVLDHLEMVTCKMVVLTIETIPPANIEIENYEMTLTTSGYDETLVREGLLRSLLQKIKGTFLKYHYKVYCKRERYEPSAGIISEEVIIAPEGDHVKK